MVGDTGFEPDASGSLTSTFAVSGTSVGPWWAYVSDRYRARRRRTGVPCALFAGIALTLPRNCSDGREPTVGPFDPQQTAARSERSLQVAYQPATADTDSDRRTRTAVNPSRLVCQNWCQPFIPSNSSSCCSTCSSRPRQPAAPGRALAPGRRLTGRPSRRPPLQRMARRGRSRRGCGWRLAASREPAPHPTLAPGQHNMWCPGSRRTLGVVSVPQRSSSSPVVHCGTREYADTNLTGDTGHSPGPVRKDQEP